MYPQPQKKCFHSDIRWYHYFAQAKDLKLLWERFASVRNSIAFPFMPLYPFFKWAGNSAPTAAAVWPRMSKQNIAGRAEISKPPIGGITLRKTPRYGSVTVIWFVYWLVTCYKAISNEVKMHSRSDQRFAQPVNTGCKIGNCVTNWGNQESANLRVEK